MTVKPYKCTSNSPLRSVYCIINYPNLLNTSAGIPIACHKARVAKKLPTYKYEKSTAVWNRTQDLLYYTQHVFNPSKTHACDSLVGCLTYSTTNGLLFDTYVNNKLPHGMSSVVAFYYELAT